MLFHLGLARIACSVDRFWCCALPGLTAIQAVMVQLSVPVLSAIAATPLLQDAMSLRSGLAAIAVLCSIALVIVSQSDQALSEKLLEQSN